MLGIKDAKFSIINQKTGETLIDAIDLLREPIIESQISANIKPNITMTMEDCKISPEFISILLGEKQPRNTSHIEVRGTRPVMVQTRKHRAKRINKKWLKRYGYKEVQVPVLIKLDECTITPNEWGDNLYTVEGKFNEIEY